jgi:hypothetical protein
LQFAECPQARQAKEHAAFEGGTPRRPPSDRPADAAAAAAPLPPAVPAQPCSTLYLQGLGHAVTKTNFLSLLPAAAKQGLVSHRLVQNGVAFLEYDGIGPAKAALAVFREGKDGRFEGGVSFEFAKSKLGGGGGGGGGGGKAM